MKKVLFLMALAAAGCTDSDPWYQQPAWGDPCVPRPDPNVLHVCHHGDWYGTGGPEAEAGYCEPVDGGGACRPWCDAGGSCPDGAVPATEPQWGYCYCTEAE